MRIRMVNAFADGPFSGNPAGVVLLDSAFPDERWMRQVAAEVNHPETAFAHPLVGAPDADWALRWFTPVTEANLCGHATLATAHILFTTGTATGTVRFRTRAGVLTVSPGESGLLTMGFPVAPLDEVPPPQGLAKVLGAEPLTCYDTGPVLEKLLVDLADERTVRALTPDLPAIALLPYRGVIVTAPADEPEGPYQFVSRFFAPAVGVPEDPVTGSAHTALAPLWSGRFGRPDLAGLQVSARRGLVGTVLRGERVDLTGRAVTVIEGDLLVHP